MNTARSMDGQMILEFKVISYNSMDNSCHVTVYKLKMQHKL